MNINSITNNIQNSNISSPATPFFHNYFHTPLKPNTNFFNNGEEYTLKSHQTTFPSLSKISPLSLAKSCTTKLSPFHLNQEESFPNSKRSSTKDFIFPSNSTPDCLNSQGEEYETIKIDKRKSIFENIQERNNESKQEIESDNQCSSKETEVNYINENTYMLKEMNKVLRKDNGKENILLCKEINININDNDSNETKKKRKEINTITFMDDDYSSIINLFPIDYEFNINEIHNDKDIYLICFLIIPRIICRNNNLELIMLTPIENNKKNSYLITFKNIYSMKILNKIDVMSISSVILFRNNSFIIKFINSISFKKERFIIYTKTNLECALFVEGLNYLIKNLD